VLYRRKGLTFLTWNQRPISSKKKKKQRTVAAPANLEVSILLDKS
jgi:hypothetical protein